MYVFFLWLLLLLKDYYYKRVIVVFGVCKYSFLIFNIKEVIGLFKICMCAFLTWLFFSMNGVIEIFGGADKNLRVCRYAFLFIWKLQINRVCQNRLLYSSDDEKYKPNLKKKICETNFKKCYANHKKSFNGEKK